MANIIGTNGNDTLQGDYYKADTINGKAGNDTIYSNGENDTSTGGGGKDKFVYVYDQYRYNNTAIITDFGGVGKGTNPTTAVIAEVDTLEFQSDSFTAQNLLLTKNGNNLEITFEGISRVKVILQNFALENLDNLSKSTGVTVDLTNILFSGQTSITNSFDVFNANSTQSTIFNLNTVTFLNDLNNNVSGFNNSDDVINGQEGDDIINGLSGNDLLRGGNGNDFLIGGSGNDSLISGNGNDSLIGGSGNDSLIGDGGNNILKGGAGNDDLNVNFSTGDNLLSGGDDNDSVAIYFADGNNTLNGGVGNDYLTINSSTGDNLLSGGDGNDSFYLIRYYDDSRSYGNNTLNGGAGDDRFDAQYFPGNNLFSGGDGNDYFFFSTQYSASLVTKTVDGGTGDDTLYSGYYDTSLTEGITSTFNATTNQGSITVGTNRVNYKNIERLDISGTRYDENIVGSNGNDTLSGSGGNDTIKGNAGDDYLISDFGGNNLVDGGDGDDNLVANYSSGNNLLNGGNGNDTLTISSTSGRNNLKGGNGNDILTGGNGNDALYGEAGTDTFVFNSYNKGIDTIYDFNATNEVIQVLAAGFGGGLSPDSLKTNKFIIGTSATTSNQRFIYNNATGGLFFDLDGSASGFTQVKFAQLSAGLPLTENNFVVV